MVIQDHSKLDRSQRQKQQRKQRVAKKLQAGFLSILCIGLIVIGFWSWRQLSDPRLLPLQHILITGSLAYTSNDELQQIIRPQLNSSFLRLNTGALQQSLLALPWISTVTIHRVWPDTLSIAMTERKPIAYWNQQGLISDQQQLFTPTTLPHFLQLPQLRGPSLDDISMVVAEYQWMNQAVRPLNLQVTALELTARHTWQVTLSNGLQIALDQKDTNQRWLRLLAYYPQIIGTQGSHIDYIDLRYSHGMAIAWHYPG